MLLIAIGLVQCTANKPPRPVPVPITNATPTMSEFPPLQPEVITKPVSLPENIPASQLPPPPAPVSEPVPPPTSQTVVESTRIEVDVSTQVLNVYAGDTIIKTYPISSAKRGVGSQAGSDKTPLGRHLIANKIGDGATLNTIFKSRVNTGKLAEIDGNNAGDLVTTRIMWLKGLEEGKNVGPGMDSYKRYIYIHGTAEEKNIGKPASHGCIRMYNQHVVELYDLVKEGLEVNILCSQQDSTTQECQYDPAVQAKMTTE